MQLFLVPNITYRINLLNHRFARPKASPHFINLENIYNSIYRFS